MEEGGRRKEMETEMCDTWHAAFLNLRGRDVTAR